MDHQSVQSVDPAELFQVVSDASAQDPLRVQRAAARLKELLQQFGTFASLQEIATDKSLPLPARQQAIIQLKNSVISHWKSRKCVFFIRAMSFSYSSCITDSFQRNSESKSEAAVSTSSMKRTTLYVHHVATRPTHTHRSHKIAGVNEVIVSKLARNDYPNTWYVSHLVLVITCSFPS
jgi:hypothetical protein